LSNNANRTREKILVHNHVLINAKTSPSAVNGHFTFPAIQVCFSIVELVVKLRFFVRKQLVRTIALEN